MIGKFSFRDTVGHGRASRWSSRIVCDHHWPTTSNVRLPPLLRGRRHCPRDFVGNRALLLHAKLALLMRTSLGEAEACTGARGEVVGPRLTGVARRTARDRRSQRLGALWIDAAVDR